MRLVITVFLCFMPIFEACVPVQTTVQCCPMLSQAVLPRRNPQAQGFEQCSVLRRLSSTCPIDGFVFCDAAPDTNPASMQIEFFNLAGNVVRTFTTVGNTLSVNVFCRGTEWTVRDGNDFVPIATVSCAQTGSVGVDRGYVVGSAVN